MDITELIDRLELANGCLIGSHVSGNTPRDQFESIINDLKQVKKFNISGVGVPKDTLCECGGNERVALDCTSKACKHPKYCKE